VDALAKLETLKVDLFIIDIMMPKMDGWELCRELRQAYDLPILMLTARGEISQKVKGFQSGRMITWSNPLSRWNWWRASKPC